MAENNTYHIYLHMDELSDSGAMAGTTGSTGAKGAANKSSDASAARVASAAKKLVSFAAVASTADKLISYEISQISLRTGATEYEQRMNAAYSLGKQVLGAGAALAGGAVVGGPAGFAVALIGVMSSGINKIINYEQNREALLTQQRLENISIGMQNIRAGTTGRRAREQ